MTTRTVLFVDDDRLTLSAIERIARNEPYRALFAANGSQALEMIASEPVCVVVTDLMMPEMDGFSFLDRVQADYPDIVRVMVSAVSDTDALLEAINRGSVYRYIPKPWRAEELRITIRQALEYFDIQDDRRRLLKDLKDANHQLRARVQQHTDQLMNLYSQAEIGKYASQIVHNLNSPLLTRTPMAAHPEPCVHRHRPSPGSAFHSACVNQSAS